MKTGNFEYNLNEHESNIEKMNKLMLYLQTKHQFHQNNLFYKKQTVFKK